MSFVLTRGRKRVSAQAALSNAKHLLGSHPDSYLTDVVMPHPVTPLGFQNVNNELKASLIENFLTPSQLLQTVIDHLGVE